jgi:hypothetical protein
MMQLGDAAYQTDKHDGRNQAEQLGPDNSHTVTQSSAILEAVARLVTIPVLNSSVQLLTSTNTPKRTKLNNMAETGKELNHRAHRKSTQAELNTQEKSQTELKRMAGPRMHQTKLNMMGGTKLNSQDQITPTQLHSPLLY